MSELYNIILREFESEISSLTIVSDPDGLMLNEAILEEIRTRGFDIIPFDDNVAFRYYYETNYRSRWDRKEELEKSVVLITKVDDFEQLPFDLLQASRMVSFELSKFFPNLSYPIVSNLDNSHYPELYLAYNLHRPHNRLGDNATRGFILRHLFGIAPELINHPHDLLRVLLRLHHRQITLPQDITDRFIQILRQNHNFKDWDITTIVANRMDFFQFLQERWPFFLNKTIGNEPNKNPLKDAEPQLAIDGPLDIPFDNDDVRVYIDNLFLEGLMQPTPFDKPESIEGTWMEVGIQTRFTTDSSFHFSKLLEKIKTSMPSEKSNHEDWLLFSRPWAECTRLFYTNSHENSLSEQFYEIQSTLDSIFQQWILNRYSGLMTLPPNPPIMPQHITRHLSRYVKDNKSFKVAILVIDGLSLDQWHTIRETLLSANKPFQFDERPIFSCIPTITSVSRQAIFSGKNPFHFPSSILRTDKEPILWEQFWMENGLSKDEIVYHKGLNENNLEDIGNLLSHPKVRVAGFVINTVDDMIHGMVLGTPGMHNQIRQWAQLPYLDNLLNLLLDHDFHVYLTSDHGNIESIGFGEPREGSAADLREKRARVYSENILREKVKQEFPTALNWEFGLPDACHVLIAPKRSSFNRPGEKVVSHGGITIEEVIVPFVTIKRKKHET